MELTEIEVKDHVKVRYCERIIGLETVIGKEELEIINSLASPKTRKAEIDQRVRAYITLNDERIVENIRLMFSYAEFIYKGSFGGDNTVKSFYLRDDIIIVSDPVRPVLITLYRVDFGFAEKNKELVDWLRGSILKLQDQVENVRAQVEDAVLRMKLENLEYEEEIRNLDSRVEALRKLRKANAEAIDAEQFKLVLVTRELESKVHHLCNNVDYKKDLMSQET